ncbi:T9SS-dependent choice-of-anchor J family protein [Marinoscillum furvescens]|uniref:Putative secreted protein (Por secretion system target) n=1 Tax=Marinoscillum furvescens DSM 4134 TaxID=1122208 RepID=A0A3D9L0X1_MARFU|nr:choice-of-anchor J domain-containing protein [Marinoscillum furvescens]RED96171.1 putative secreted protein (Por secretion system target) [Marinoscillum furvescens DSM 4134]
MKALIAVLFTLLTLASFAQERCATMQLPANKLRSESTAEFEAWLSNRKSQFSTSHRRQQQVYEIPVVFHVIHDGSDVGFGSNLPDERIIEQLEILNEDFRRTNADASDTPNEFLSVAADTEIEFVFARQDPEGLPTDGIVRIQGAKSEYSISDDAALMAESFWPHEHYINFYITNLSGNNLGYAQFPFSNLEGIASELENYRSTDGIVIDYVWVGRNTNTGSFDSHGRTATHEMGHYLGLRHIWGDGGCSAQDYCDDTPEAASSSSGCPTNKNTCDSKDMVQNYMDYTDDRCMNLFTVCQKERMRTVLETSPRRKTLLTSPGLQTPVLVANNLGARSIIAPQQSDCAETTTPSLQVRNYGTNEITSFEVALYLNGSRIETQSKEVLLATGETSQVSFSPLTIDHTVSNNVRFEVISVNGTTDAEPENDIKEVLLAPSALDNIPFYEDFEESNTYFRRAEQGNTSTWTFSTAPDSTSGNQAAMAPYYNQEVNFGLQDRLITKTLDFSGLTSAQLEFNYAYAPRRIPGTSHFYLDGLIVAVSTDCGQNFHLHNYEFERYGLGLNTTQTQDSSFAPSVQSDWSPVSLNLTKYAGQENVQIAFIGVNGGGNNIYIDNISVSSGELLADDVGIRGVDNIPVVTCDQFSFPSLEIKNYGYEDVTSLHIKLQVNETTKTFEYTDLNIPSGDDQNFTFNLSDDLQDGPNDITFTIETVNGRTDLQPGNNQRTFRTLVDLQEEVIPIQEDFENMQWVTFSPEGENLYYTQMVEGDLALTTNNYDNPVTGRSYLVSPTLITSGYTEAAIRFRYSYAERTGFNDNLKVLLSHNCGRTFDVELLNLNSEQMAIVSSSAEWDPESEDLWRTEFIDITEHLKYPDLRVAFVFTNGNGNKLYLDDIDILTTNDPKLPEFQQELVVYPNPSHGDFRVTFNLPEKKELEIQIMDMSGRIIYQQVHANILNQTLRFQAPSQGGFYVLHVKGDGYEKVERLFIKR